VDLQVSAVSGLDRGLNQNSLIHPGRNRFLPRVRDKHIKRSILVGKLDKCYTSNFEIVLALSVQQNLYPAIGFFVTAPFMKMNIK